MLGVRAQADPPSPPHSSQYIFRSKAGGSLGDSLQVGEKGTKANSCLLLQPILEELSL